MKMIEKLGLIALRRLDPERAHGVALKALQMGIAPVAAHREVTSSRLQCQVAGLQLDNPLGLAAGFDKNAQATAPLAQAGFGFLEVGAAPPQAQNGNSKPRLFRLTEDRAVINRFGFNNDGMVAISDRMQNRPKGAVVGLNLGANKDSSDRAEDFATVNVSSPNTESLRDLQGKAALSALLTRVLDTKSALPHPLPIFVKIAPDLDRHELEDVAEVALSSGIDGIIATNTTLNRDGLQNRHRGEKGGLSGAPLFERSTQVLARLSELTDGNLPLIGVGGIGSAEDAYAKIRAGAQAVQLYSALVYAGLSLVQDSTPGLDALLLRDGFNDVTEAVGTARADWL